MEEQSKLSDLSQEERKALEELMPDDMNEIIASGIKRRHFLKLFAVTGTSLLAANLLGIEQLMARSVPIEQQAPLIADGVSLSLEVNGSSQKLMVDSRMTLLDTLRERLNLTGSKKVVTMVSVVPVQF